MGKSVNFFFLLWVHRLYRSHRETTHSLGRNAPRPLRRDQGPQWLTYCGNLSNVTLQRNGTNVRTSVGPSPLVTSLSLKLLPFDPRLCPPRRHPGGKMEGE